MGHLDPYETVYSIFNVLKGMRSVLVDVIFVTMSSRTELSPTVNEWTASQQILDPRSRRCNTQSGELRQLQKPLVGWSMKLHIRLWS